MSVNRFAHLFAEPAAPATPTGAIPPGFAFCPIFIVQVNASAMQDIYRQAYEQAQQKARISQLEKRFFSVWN